MKKIIIIGSGISGLSAGIYGLLNGYDVEMYEKNHEAGGFLTSWKRSNTIIDGCLHWMCGTKDGTGVNRVWKEIGGLDGVEIIHPNAFFTAQYNNQTVTFYRDIDKLKESLLSVSDNDEEEIEYFIESIKAIGIMENPSDIPYELIDPKLLRPNMALLKKVGKYLKLTVEDLANRFNSEIIRFALLNAPVNKKFAAFYFIQTLSNFVLGNDSLPKGGSHKLRDRLVNKFNSLGGVIHYNSNIDEILVKDNKAYGIKLIDNSEIYSDYVISAIDPHYTYECLLKNKYEMKPYIDMDNDKNMYPTYSFIIASYKTKHDFSSEEIAQVYNVDEYELLNKKHDYLSFRHYGYDDEYIKDGYTPVQVMLCTWEDDFEYLKSLNRDDYKDLKNKIGEFYKAKLESLYNCEFELVDVLTPLTYSRYTNNYKGGFMTYTLSPKASQYVRSALVDGVDNLVLANQWLVLPGGTPIAVVSGKFAIQHILNLDGLVYNIDK